MVLFRSRYVAGNTLSDGLHYVQKTNNNGFCATLDVLGEEITTKSEAQSVCSAYCEMLDNIHHQNLDCNVSLKLSSLGLNIDTTFCWDNLQKILEKADSYENFVRIDMENSETTNATLNMTRKASRKI